jgi:hypothetical protein
VKRDFNKAVYKAKEFWELEVWRLLFLPCLRCVEFLPRVGCLHQNVHCYQSLYHSEMLCFSLCIRRNDFSTQRESPLTSPSTLWVSTTKPTLP